MLAAEPAGLFAAWLAALRAGEPIIATTTRTIAPVLASAAASAAFCA